MQRLRTVLTILMLLSTSPAALWAADSVPEKLSLAQAVAMALEANVGLKSAEEAHLASLSRLRVATLPTSLDAVSTARLEHSSDETDSSSLAYGELSYRNLFGTEASFAVSPFGFGSERASVGLTIRHPLTTGRGVLSEKGALAESARSSVSIRKEQLYMSRQSTVLAVIQAYYRAVLAREQVKIQEEAITIAEQALDGARKREKARLIAGIEVSRAEINLALTRDALNIQRAAARGTLDRLMLAIGQGMGQSPELELTDPVPDVNPATPDLGEAIKIALANRSELAVYDEQLADEERSVAIAEEQLRPELDVVARFSSTSTDTGFVSGSIIDLGYSTAGIELRFPLDKRATREERDTASRALNILREQRAFETEEISEQVRAAVRALESARTSLSIYSQNLDVAKERHRLAERMVEEGEGSNREVLEAQEALTRVKGGLLSAKVDLYLATVNLKYAMGEDLTTMRTE